MEHNCKTCAQLECPFRKRSAYLEFRFPMTFTTRREFRLAVS